MEPKTRVDVLVLDQGRGVWGAQRYLLRLAPMLAAAGFQLTLANPADLELNREWREAGFAVIDLPLPLDRSIRHGSRLSFPKVVGAAFGVRRVVCSIASTAQAGGFEIIMANSHWIHLDASIAGRLLGIPTVLHLHEEAVPGFGSYLRTLAVRLASRTVAVSEAVAEGLPGRVRGSVRVIPNGIDTNTLLPKASSRVTIRAELGLRRDDVVALAMTRLDPVKRIEDLITAVAKIGDTNLKLVIAGNTSAFPEYAANIRAQAEALGPNRVVLCGHRSDTTDLLNAADFLVHAGVVEGMPLGLLEAQSCGIPVVAYSVAGVPEAVIDGTTGILVPRGDVLALANSIAILAADRGLREQMGSAAREHVVENHQIELQAIRNIALLNEVVNDSRDRIRV